MTIDTAVFTWDRETSSWCFLCYKRESTLWESESMVSIKGQFNSKRKNVSRIITDLNQRTGCPKDIFPLFFPLALAVNRSPAVYFIFASDFWRPLKRRFRQTTRGNTPLGWESVLRYCYLGLLQTVLDTGCMPSPLFLFRRSKIENKHLILGRSKRKMKQPYLYRKEK